MCRQLLFARISCGIKYLSHFIQKNTDLIYKKSPTFFRHYCSTSSQFNIKDDDDFVEFTDEEGEKLKQMKTEYEIWKYADDEMPDEVSDADWKNMLSLKTANDRISYLTRLYRKKILKKFTYEKKMERKALSAEYRKVKSQNFQPPQTDQIVYSQSQNTLHRRFDKISIYSSLRSLNAYLNGPKIVLDFSFMNQLSYIEQCRAFSELKNCMTNNLTHRQPAALILSSFDKNSEWFENLSQRFMGNFDNYPFYMSEKSYRDLYPNDNLVYLSADADEQLNEFDLDKIYVVGVVVDFGEESHPYLTATKAKEQKIITRRLPLNYYTNWDRDQCLHISQVVTMLLDFNLTNDWYTSINRNKSRDLQWHYQTPTDNHEIRRKLMKSRMKFLTTLTTENK